MSGENIFKDLSRGVPGYTPREMAPPKMRFEPPENVVDSKALRYEPHKLFLGVIGAAIERDETGQRFAQGGHEIGVADDQHAITIAGSRTGKGRAAIIPNMLRYAGSALAIDPKGELATETAEVRARTLGQQVWILDPFATTGDDLAALHKGFNPIAQMRSESAVEDAVLIADALIVPEGRDPHWDESARTFLEGVILEVFTSPRFDRRRDLVTVRDLIAQGEQTDIDDDDDNDDDHDDDDGDRGLPKGMSLLRDFMLESDHPAVRRAAADFFERPPRERDSVLSTTRRHLRALSFPEIERSLRGDGVDLSALKTGRTTIYLCLPARHMGPCGRWLRLFVNLALQAMERTPGAPVAGCPVLFVLDEFATLGHMRQIEDAAGQIASYGVKLWPILQDLGQLKALYKERWETFMGNAGTLQFFGNNDLTTLEWVSKRLGSTTIEQASSSHVTPRAADAGAQGDSYAPRTTPILEPEEVAVVFGRPDKLLRQLIIRPGYAPMILQRAYYDKHEAFGRTP